MRVLVLAEYYPRAEDPVLGVWAHRQAIAARDAGAEVRVLVLHRPVPPLVALRGGDLRVLAGPVRQPAHAVLDGISIRYLRYLSPPRAWSYGSWGAWAAPSVRLALAAIRRSFPFDLVHAHYAVPAGDAVRRASPRAPMVVSVHGHDVYGAGSRMAAVAKTLAHARLVLANSAGTARRCTQHGARATRVIHLGADLPAPLPGAAGSESPTLVTVGHLVARKRHADVIRALGLLRERHPTLRYTIVGDGPEREPLRALAVSLGVEPLVTLRGQLPPDRAANCARGASVFVLPSVDEAFGVAYIEAMAGGAPAIGCQGEDGPEEIAACGGGIALVPPRDPRALAEQIHALLCDPQRRAEIGAQARATVRACFSWSKCGQETVAAYQDALRAR